MNLLELALFIPLAGFFLVMLVRREALAFTVALVATLATFVVSLGLIAPAQGNPAQFSSVIDWPWVGNLGIRFHFGVDGINLWLLVLAAFLLPIAVWISQSMIPTRRTTFYALLLLFEFGLIGVFSALDLFAFYVFWEVALVPMYLMVGSFGGVRRGPAAVKFFVYTMLGSVLMLCSILYLHSLTGSFEYSEILSRFTTGQVSLTPVQQLWLFLGFFAAFAVKVPIVPFHTWLPATYTEAPTPATFLLAAIMSKMGTYGLLRYAVALVPAGAHRCTTWIIPLAILGVLYGALLALIQPNFKRLIAYSSISHLGFIVLGIFSFTQQGTDGAVYLMVAHGLSTGALFLLAGYLEQRRASTEIADYGGIAVAAPGLAVAFMIALLASIGLPTLCNFVGEFLVLQGAAIAHFSWAVWAAIGVILSAAYMLWFYQRAFFGKPSERNQNFPDLTMRDWVPVIPLVALMIWLGTYTQSFMPSISAATAHTLDQTRMSEEYRVQAFPAESARARLPQVQNAR